MFTNNVGSVDQVVRLIMGAAVIALGVAYSNWLGLVGVILIVTAFLRWCPAYVPFKVSTCAVENASE